MKLLKKYLFNTLSQTFFPIFLTLYIVTSIIFLVKIASLTSIIQMNFIELIELYSYSIPHIIFYTLPISFFIGMAISISKLSSEYELIIITSFGLNPTKILQILLPITMFMSVLLLIISLGLIPKSEYLRENFINKKEQEAQFNIEASKYGQKIASWLIYVNKKEKAQFKDMTLLKIEPNKDTLISAKRATTHTTNNTLTMHLSEGKSFAISDTIQQIDFKTMLLVNTTSKSKNMKTLNDFISYWDDRNSDLGKSKDFTFNILISLLPLLSLFFILATGYFNPRYDTNKTTVISSVLLIVYVILANQLAKLYPNTGLVLLPIFWFMLGYIYYSLTTKKLY